MDQQTMVYVVFILGACLLLWIQYVVSKRNRYQSLCRKVREQWGKVPDREYSLEEFEKISHFYEKRKGSRFSIDDITWNDLGMDEVFLLLNTAGSAVGEEYLYQVLRTPEFDTGVLKERSALADHFRSHQKEREAFGICFAQMGRRKRVALADYIEKLSDVPRQPLFLHILCLLLLAASIGSFAFEPAVGVGFLLVVMVFNIVTYYRYKGRVGKYFQCMSQVAELVEYGSRMEEIPVEGELLNPYKERLRNACGVLRPIRSQAWILVDKTGIGASLMEAVFDYLCMVTHLDLILFRRISSIVRDKGEVLEDLMKVMGELELGLCIGSFREYLQTYCEPELSGDKACRLSCRDIYHPLIEGAVANSIQADRPVLVTGSNASGKSTFLKTIGVGAILAQTIYTVPAKQYESCFFRVFSSMALADNLESGESYYMVEIKSLKRILDAIPSGGAPVLCFIDEVLRGTNTVERISASSKILESMSGKPVLCFAATHDIELTALLSGVYDNYHFEEQIEGNDVLFSYKLYPGRAATRNAIRLLAIMGYEEGIIREAEEMAERFVKTGEWSLEP